MTKQSKYTATATASNSHNWLLRFEITPAELYELYNGNEDDWLQACESGDWEPTVYQDEGAGGTIEIDGDACLEDEPDPAVLGQYYSTQHYQAWKDGDYYDE